MLPHEQIAINVRAAAVRAGVNHTQIGEVLKLNKVPLSHRMNGHTSFRIDELATLAKYFGIGIDELYRDVDLSPLTDAT